MKIGLVSSLYGPEGGGAGLVVQQLAEGLIKVGHQVFVITTGDGRRPIKEKNAGIKVYSFHPVNLYSLQEKDTHPLWEKAIWQLVDIYNPLVKSTFRNILCQERPDIIHIHKMRSFSGTVWKLATELAPGRVIQTCHDYESMSPEGTLQGRIGKWAQEGKWPIRWYQLARARLSRNISWVTAPSAFTLATITKSGLFPSAKRKVIPNTHGWTFSELDEIRQNANQSEYLHLLYLGRLEPEKGLRELCSAFFSVVSRYPESHLTIAGWGSLEAELRQAYGSCPDITFAGKVFGKDKNRLLSSITALIVPSTCQEAFGTVVTEGYAYGKPVIASRIGGMPELVREGETGWLVEPANIDALARAIEAAAQNPSLLHKMSSTCFDAAKSFTIEEMISMYEKVYQDVMLGYDTNNTNPPGK